MTSPSRRDKIGRDIYSSGAKLCIYNVNYSPFEKWFPIWNHPLEKTKHKTPSKCDTWKSHWIILFWIAGYKSDALYYGFMIGPKSLQNIQVNNTYSGLDCNGSVCFHVCLSFSHVNDLPEVPMTNEWRINNKHKTKVWYILSTASVLVMNIVDLTHYRPLVVWLKGGWRKSSQNGVGTLVEFEYESHFLQNNNNKYKKACVNDLGKCL